MFTIAQVAAPAAIHLLWGQRAEGLGESEPNVMLPQVKEKAFGDEVGKHVWVLLNENSERLK